MQKGHWSSKYLRQELKGQFHNAGLASYFCGCTTSWTTQLHTDKALVSENQGCLQKVGNHSEYHPCNDCQNKPKKGGEEEKRQHFFMI